MNTPVNPNVLALTTAQRAQAEFQEQLEEAKLMRELFDLCNAQEDGFILVDFEEHDDDEDFQRDKLRKLDIEIKKEKRELRRLTIELLQARDRPVRYEEAKRT